METWNRLGVILWRTLRILKAEVIETVLYGCVTWRPNKLDYAKLREARHFTTDASDGGN